MKNNYNKLLNNTIIFTLGNFGTKILTFFLVPLYTSVLSTSEYGTADIITTTVNMLVPLLTLSIYEATLRFTLDKYENKKGVFSISLLFCFGGTFVISLFSILMLFFDIWFRSYVIYVPILFCTISLQICFANYIKGIEKTLIYAVQGIIYTLAYCCSNIVTLVVLKKGINGYLDSIVVGNLASCIFMFCICKLWKDINLKVIDWLLLQRMVKFCLPLTPSTLLWWLSAYSDKYMLVLLVGTSANGLYSVANKIPTIFISISGVFLQAWRLSSIEVFDNNDNAFLQNVYSVYYITASEMCLVLCIISPVIAKLLFREDYYIAWTFVPLLLMAALMEGMAGFLSSIYVAAKKTNIMMVSTVVGVLVNLGFNYFLISKIGALGATMATAISFWVVWIIRSLCLKKIIKLDINYYRLNAGIVMMFITMILFAGDVKVKTIIAISNIIILGLLYKQEVLFLINMLKKEKR